MKKGTHHRPETLERLRAHWSARQSAPVEGTTVPHTEIDETAVARWLMGLPDSGFIKFMKTHCLPRIRELRGP